METIAFYRETIIKTYGFVEKTGLALITVEFPSKGLADWEERLLDLPAQTGGGLVLLMGRMVTETVMRLHVLLDEIQNAQDLNEARRVFKSEDLGDHVWRLEKEVEMVFFQGPHYGDRYGIAGAAVSALSNHQVPILAMACSGASVYLILPRDKAHQAKVALGTAFTVPQRVHRESES
jgi:aspartokinase